MTHLESNLNCLENNLPALAKKIRSYLATNPLAPLPLDSLGKPNLPVESPSGKTWLYPPTLASDLGQMQEQLLAVYNPQVMIWMGLGLGYHLTAYLEKPHPLNEFQIVIEPSLETFCHFLAQADRRSLLSNPHFFWLVDLPVEQLGHVFQEIKGVPNFSTAAINRLTVQWMPSTPYFEAAGQAWEDFCETNLLFQYDPPIDSYYGFMNFMQNFSKIPGTPLLQGFKGAFAGKPGIVVSTGPSLTYSMDLLQQLKNRAVLFSVDSSMHILMKQGIVPPFTGCLERMVATQKHFEGFDTSRTALITTPFLHPETLKTFKGPRAFFVQEHHFLPWFYPGISIDRAPLTSVAHLGLYSLWQMGCSPIILLGQDLAFDPKKKTSHAAGSHWIKDQADAEKMGTETKIRVPANQGGEVDTTAGWRQFAKIFSQLIHAFQIDCYNAIPRGHGMVIDGARWMDPQELPNFLKNEIDLTEGLKRCQNAKDVLDRNPETLRQKAQLTQTQLEAVIQKCQTVIQEIHDFFLNNPPGLMRSQTAMHYESFFKKIQDETEAYSQEPILNHFVYRVTSGVHNHLLRKSFTLMAEKNTDPDVLLTKLAIPLGWYVETLVKAKLMLRKIKKQHEKRP